MRTLISALIATMLGAMSLFVPHAAYAAQPHRAHAESCTHVGWGFLWAADYNFGTVNRCSYAVDVWVMASSGEQANAQVPAGGVFNSGLPSNRFDTNNWIAAVCRAGYRPSIEFSQSNWDALRDGRYSCVRPGSAS